MLFQNRPDAFEVLGGDTIQMLQTARHLRALGLEVDISTAESGNVKKYDIVHIFNIFRPRWSYLQLENAVRQRRPVVISPIYWDERELVQYTISRLIRELDLRDLAAAAGEWVLRRLNGIRDWRGRVALLPDRRMQRYVLDTAARILPNSDAELQMLVQSFGVSDSKVSVVYNGVDSIACEDSRQNSTSVPSGCVLMVARFDQRKNQLGLIRALKRTDLKLVFVGGPIRESQLSVRYYEQCRREAGPGTLFLPPMDHAALGQVYRVCKVHAMPSLYETPGLSSLEAGAHGANVVTTDRGSAKEYFGPLAWYCDPTREASIRDAVLRAYESPRSEALKSRIQTTFTWERAARDTAAAYSKILGR